MTHLKKSLNNLLPALLFEAFCNNLNTGSALLVYSIGVLPALSFISKRQPWLIKRPIIVSPIVVLRMSKSFTRMCRTVSPLLWALIFDDSIGCDFSKYFKNSALPEEKAKCKDVSFDVVVFCSLSYSGHYFYLQSYV